MYHIFFIHSPVDRLRLDIVTKTVISMSFQVLTHNPLCMFPPELPNLITLLLYASPTIFYFYGTHTGQACQHIVHLSAYRKINLWEQNTIADGLYLPHNAGLQTLHERIGNPNTCWDKMTFVLDHTVSETHGKQVVQVGALNQSLWALVKANVGHPTLPLAEEVWLSLGKNCFRVNRKKSTRNRLCLLQTPMHGLPLTPRQGGVLSIGFKTAQTQIWPLNWEVVSTPSHRHRSWRPKT